MNARLFGELVLFSLVFPACNAHAERTLFASYDGKGGYHQGVWIEEAPRLEEVLARVKGRLTETTVVQLLTKDAAASEITVFRNDRGVCSFRIENVTGSSDHSLIVRGVRNGRHWVTQIEGDSVQRVIDGQFGCQKEIAATKAVEPRRREPIALRLRQALSEEPGAKSAGAQIRLVRCFHLKNSRRVVFENLAFKDCWLPAILMVDSAEVTIRDNIILGSSYAIFAISIAKKPREVRTFKVLNNVWIQDTSGYGSAIASGSCASVQPPYECPGDIWTRIPWGVSHDTWFEHMNGALFGSSNIWGDVEFRENTVTNAYNGFRMVVTDKCANDPACITQVNRDVSIIENTFLYVRDNPVEPEVRAVNWTIARNTIKNSHAWFSFDEVGGGPIYIWGNRGWHTAVPGTSCTKADEQRYAKHMVVDFVKGGHIPVVTTEPPDAFTCAASRYGTIIKEGSHEGSTNKDIYIFHNSWFVRTPVVRGGLTGRIHYWNNAMFVNACGVRPDDFGSLCRIELEETDPKCKHRDNFLTDDGTSLFVKCIDQAQFRDPKVYDFRFNVTNKGFPAEFLKVPGRQDALVIGEPQFVDPGRGDFRFKNSRSPAVGNGCIVEWEDQAKGILRCRVPEPSARPDIGAFSRDGILYNGPR